MNHFQANLFKSSGFAGREKAKMKIEAMLPWAGGRGVFGGAPN